MALIRAKEAIIRIGTTIATVSSTTTILSQITGYTVWSGNVRDVNISGGESDQEIVYLFGSDTNSRQNTDSYDKPTSQREFSGTLILSSNAAAALASSAASSVGTTGVTRVQGDGTKTARCIFVRLIDSSGNTLDCVLNNAKFTKLGDIKLDSEGFAEQEIMAKCEPSDYYEDYDAA